jgi:hypothetical protein
MGKERLAFYPLAIINPPNRVIATARAAMREAIQKKQRALTPRGNSMDGRAAYRRSA